MTIIPASLYKACTFPSLKTLIIKYAFEFQKDTNNIIRYAYKLQKDTNTIIRYPFKSQKATNTSPKKKDTNIRKLKKKDTVMCRLVIYVCECSDQVVRRDHESCDEQHHTGVWCDVMSEIRIVVNHHHYHHHNEGG